jgi:hypothetical protein
MVHSNTPAQTILDQLAEELCRHNRGLITELPRWMY